MRVVQHCMYTTLFRPIFIDCGAHAHPGHPGSINLPSHVFCYSNNSNYTFTKKS